MRNNFFYARLLCIALFQNLFTYKTVNGQIVPDATLPKFSEVVTNQQGTTVINGGTRVGNNLFHSFNQFSILSRNIAFFNNPLDIQNIITRVTGNSASNIDGILRANGNANLFLINPHGFSFGRNASVDIGGSLLVSSASSINFSDGTQFSATNPQAPPLLTINVPIGLNFTSEPGAIEVEGAGHNLNLPSSLVGGPLTGGGSSINGLRLNPNKTFTLVGGNVNLSGGIITVPDGQIQIGSVDRGEKIGIIPNLKGWNLDYTSVKKFQNIELNKLSLLDTSGYKGGSIFLQGNQITLLNSSFILSQALIGETNQKININAAQSLILEGTTSNLNFNQLPLNAAKIRTAIVSQDFSGQGADINISTKKLELESGGEIVASSLQSGSGGKISITASDIVQVNGASIIDPANNVSTILTGAFNSGKSGDIRISTGKLLIQNGASVNSGNAGTVAGGNISIDASDLVLLNGGISDIPLPSLLSSSTFSSGKAGELIINTPRLAILNGASVSTNTSASGSAGNLIINAPDSIVVSGFLPNRYQGYQGITSTPSNITSGAFALTSSQKQLLGFFPELTGNSGNITINTNNLTINNTGLVSVANSGTGNAGSITIRANSIILDNLGSITAVTTNGLGGNINLLLTNQLKLDHNSLISATSGGQSVGGNITIDPQTTTIFNGSGITVNSTGTGNAGQLKISSSNLILNNGSFLSANTNGGEGGNLFLRTQNLQLRHNSNITASGQGGGNGGNINIHTPILAALENSTISANALNGTGGKVTINAQSVFSSLGAITAIGKNPQFDGIVQINIPAEINLARAAGNPVTPPQSPQVVSACSVRSGSNVSSLVNTGTGGIPPSSSDPLTSNTGWQDTSLPLHTGENARTVKQQATSQPDEFLPVTGWIVHPDGTMNFTSNAQNNVQYSASTTCHQTSASDR